MKQYRKKPVVIEAILASEAIVLAVKDWGKLPAWLRNSYEKGKVVFSPNGISILTLEGAMWATPGDWIICGVTGELYPCKPDIFEMTYEAVE